MATVELYRPTSEPAADRGAALAPRRVDLSAATLLVICNGKPKARELLTFIAEEIQARLGVQRVQLHQKPAASTLLDERFVQEHADGATLVLAGVGDCGSCSACSVHDAIQFEKQQTPAAMILTTAFEQHVESFARTFGMPGYPPVVVPHPVSTRSDQELRQIAADVAPTVIRRLVEDAPHGRETTPQPS